MSGHSVGRSCWLLESLLSSSPSIPSCSKSSSSSLQSSSSSSWARFCCKVSSPKKRFRSAESASTSLQKHKHSLLKLCMFLAILLVSGSSGLKCLSSWQKNKTKNNKKPPLVRKKNRATDCAFVLNYVIQWVKLTGTHFLSQSRCLFLHQPASTESSVLGERMRESSGHSKHQYITRPQVTHLLLLDAYITQVLQIQQH